MGEKKTMKLTIAAGPKKETWGQQNDRSRHRFMTAEGEEFITFSDQLAEAFETAELRGKEHEYVVEMPDDPKWSPKIIEIVGVYKQGGGPGGRGNFQGGGGGLTHRQVALFAAVQNAGPGADPDSVLANAEGFFAWLRMGRGDNGSGAPSSSPGADAGSSSDSPSEDKDSGPVPPSSEKAKELAEFIAGTFPDRERLAESWTKSALGRYKVDSLDQLDDEAIATLKTELMAIRFDAEEEPAK